MIATATAKIDDLGRPAWIALMVLGFIVWWPVGLAILAYIFWSGRMRHGCYGGGEGRWEHKMQRMQEKMDRMRNRMQGGGGGWHQAGPTSGNRAFDDYRNETLKRLEEEQKEFREFLERLRFAKDKTEFDEFMNDRRNRGPSSPTPPAPQPQA